MNQQRQIRNVVLTGFMGVGKTTIGRLLSQRLHYEFIDTDHRIEGEQGLTISEIFSRFGEARFRECERELVRTLESTDQSVISVGGGLVIDPDNVTSLKKHALIVCLWAGPESIMRRVLHQSHRPLLQTENPEQTVRDMLEHRGPIYRTVADVLISTEFRSAQEVVSHVERQFRMARRQAAPS